MGFSRQDYWSGLPLPSPFVSLGKLIPRYLIIFVAMANGIDLLISLSDFSLLVYRNASGFCVLILLGPHGLYSPWNSPGQKTGVGGLSLLQGIVPTQGSDQVGTL